MIEFHGFLDANFAEELSSSTISYKDAFKEAENLSAYGYEIFDKIDGKPKPNRFITDFYTLTTISAHKTYQAIALLFKLGLHNEAMALMRTLLEMLFQLKAVYNNNENINLIFENDRAKRQRLFKQIENGHIDASHISKDLLETLKSDLINDKASPLLITQLAQLAEMEDYYYLIYSHLSGQVHYSVNTMLSNATADRTTGKITELSCLPIFEDTDQYLKTATNLLLTALSILIEHYRIDIVSFEDYRAHILDSSSGK